MQTLLRVHLHILDLDVGISSETSHQVDPTWSPRFAGILIVAWIVEHHWCMLCCLLSLRFMLTH